MIDLQVVRNICIAGAAFYGTAILIATATQLWSFLQSPPI